MLTSRLPVFPASCIITRDEACKTGSREGGGKCVTLVDASEADRGYIDFGHCAFCADAYPHFPA